MNRIRSILLPAAALIFGIAGGLLRSREMGLVYDQAGLPVPGHSATVTLAAASAIFVLLLAAGAFAAKKTPGAYEDYFGAGSKIPALLTALSGCVLIFSSVVQLFSAQGEIFKAVALFFTIVAGVCLFYLGLVGLTGKRTDIPAAAMLAPVFCFCLRLIYVYKGFSADPVIINYVYELMSVVAVTLALFFESGFAFGIIRPRLTAAVSLAGVYFSVLTLLDAHRTEDPLFFVFSALFLLGLAIRTLPLRQKEAS